MCFRSNPVLKRFWRKPNIRNRILYGGRVSSKSWDAAARAIIIAHNKTVRFLCTRQFQNKIEESVYTLLKNIIYVQGLESQFNILNNKIIHRFTGSEFVFYGLWRHIEEIRSLEGIDYCWIEEGHALTPNQFSLLEPTIRKEGSEIWIIFNPDVSTDFVYQNFVVNPPSNTLIQKINYTENPHISNTILNIINDLKSRDYDEYEHVYLGVPYDDDEGVIIKRSWINAAIDAHIKLGFEPLGPTRIGYDIADDGGDRCANIVSRGSVALYMDYWKANEDELLKSCKKTYANALEWNNAHITYDATGVGAHAGAKFKEINQEREDGLEIGYQKFQSAGAVVKPEKKYSEQVKNKDMFANLKAQSWWLVADRFRNTWDAVQNGTQYDPDDLISLSSNINDIEKLVTELSTPKKDYDKANRVKVESKKDLEEREVKSPDLADAFIMAFAPVTSRRSVLDVLLAA